MSVDILRYLERTQLNLPGVESALAVCTLPGKGVKAILLSPEAPEQSHADISVDPIQSFRSSHDAIDVMVGLLSRGVTLSDVQLLFSPTTGAALLIDLTEGYILPPILSALDQARVRSFISELSTIVKLQDTPSLYRYAVGICDEYLVAAETNRNINKQAIETCRTYLLNFIDTLGV